MIELSISIFLALTLGLAILPFVPAIAEWRRKRDVEPLRVLRASQVDVHHFAIGFRKYVESTFGPLPDAWQELEKSGQGTMEDGQPYIVVGKNKLPGLNGGLARNEPYHPLILSHGDLQLPGRMTFMTEIFVDGSVTVREETVLRAILAEKEYRSGAGEHPSPLAARRPVRERSIRVRSLWAGIRRWPHPYRGEFPIRAAERPAHRFLSRRGKG